MVRRKKTEDVKVKEEFYWMCGLCGHVYRDDELGDNLKDPEDKAAYYPAKSRIKSADAFHEYHESHCANPEDEGCNAQPMDVLMAKKNFRIVQ